MDNRGRDPSDTHREHWNPPRIEDTLVELITVRHCSAGFTANLADTEEGLRRRCVLVDRRHRRPISADHVWGQPEGAGRQTVRRDGSR